MNVVLKVTNKMINDNLYKLPQLQENTQYYKDDIVIQDDKVYKCLRDVFNKSNKFALINLHWKKIYTKK